MRRTLGSFLALAAMTLALAAAAPCAALADEVVSSADSAPISLDTRTGPRASDGSEALTYSTLWGGGASSLTILQDGAVIASGLTGEGTYDWSVPYDGTYVLTLKTDSGAELGTATFVVSGKGSPSAATHALTVAYVYSDGSQAAPTFSQAFAEGAAYSVASPAIKGFAPSIALISGTMGPSDVFATVTYSAAPAAAPSSQPSVPPTGDASAAALAGAAIAACSGALLSLGALALLRRPRA